MRSTTLFRKKSLVTMGYNMLKQIPIVNIKVLLQSQTLQIQHD